MRTLRARLFLCVYVQHGLQWRTAGVCLEVVYPYRCCIRRGLQRRRKGDNVQGARPQFTYLEQSC